MLDLLRPFIGSLLRHVFTTIAGSLIANGYLQSAQTEQFVGACMLFFGIGWAAWHKVNTPEVLAHLNDRAQQRTQRAKQKWQDTILNQQAGALVLAVVAAGLLLAPAPADAKDLKLRQFLDRVEGKPSTLTQLFGHIQKANPADLEFARALADQQKGNVAAEARARCYAAVQQMVAATSSAKAAAPALAPSSVFTRFEQMNQVSGALSPLSPVQQACSPVAQSMKMDTPQLLLGILSGSLTINKLPVP